MAKLEDRIRSLRDQLGDDAVPKEFGGVSKSRITQVLKHIGRDSQDEIDTVFSLLDDRDSWFTTAPDHIRFCDGATVAHIGCHVGILQRGQTKADREAVRDYWIKPLRELGAIEAVSYQSKTKSFVAGHPVAKSANSAYRLEDAFRKVLGARRDQWLSDLEAWSSIDATRKRAEFQAKAAAEVRRATQTKHSDLIKRVVEFYVPAFLSGYQVIYVDDGDGDRITAEQRTKLETAGIEIQLSDAMPDVLLWHPGNDSLWVVEAVTSDGEVDLTKFAALTDFANRYGKAGIGMTTAYPTWKVAGQRQHKHKNLAPGTFIWIADDASNQMEVRAFPTEAD